MADSPTGPESATIAVGGGGSRNGGVPGADGRRRVEPGSFTVRVADREATVTVEDRQ